MRIGIASDNGEDVDSVYHWLRADRDLRDVEIRGVPSRDRSVMSAMESVLVVCSVATQLALLAQTIVAWRGSGRPRGIILSRSDGTTLALEPGTTVTTDVLERFLRPDDGTDRGPRG